MGEMAEAALEEEWEDPFFNSNRNTYRSFRSMSDTHWMQIDGTIIPISEMTKSHIENSMALLKRNRQNDLPAYVGLKRELEKRK